MNPPPPPVSKRPLPPAAMSASRPAVIPERPAATAGTDSSRRKARTPLQPGTQLGEYTIVGKLGQGGFGITYRARHTQHGTGVVIKEHIPEGMAIREEGSNYVICIRPEDEARYKATLNEFKEEASVLMALDHPGIVPILSAFAANGTAYYVMSYLAGSSLEPAAEITLNQEKLARHARQVKSQLRNLLHTLDYMEQHNIVHRDIKPENILITRDGSPVLLDFGSARQLQPGKVFTNVYTPDFCAAEQSTAKNDRTMSESIGPWTDIYSLAASFYYIITRLTPPRSDMRSLSSTDPYKPLAPRGDLVALYGQPFLESIDRALELRPEDRWQDAASWLTAIEEGIIPTSVKTLWRMRIFIGTTLVILLILGYISLWALRERSQAMEMYTSGLSFTEDILYDFNAELSDMPGATRLQRQLGTQLSHYLDKMESFPVKDNEQLLRAHSTAWLNLCSVYIGQSKLDDAMEAHDKAVDALEEQKSNHPGDPGIKYERARAWMLLSEICRRRNHKSAAQQSLKEAVVLLKDVCLQVPDNPDYKCALGEAYRYSADMAGTAGDTKEQQKIITEMITIYRDLMARYPEHASTLLGLGYALQRSARLDMEQGMQKKAGKQLSEARDIFASLVTRNPYKLTFIKGYAVAYFTTGELLMRVAAATEDKQARLERENEAIVAYSQHIALAQELSSMDGENMEYTLMQCQALTPVIEILLDHKQYNQAESFSQKMADKVNVLLEHSPDNTDFILLKAGACRSLAKAYAASPEKTAKAAKEFANYRHIIEDLLEESPTNTQLIYAYVDALTESATFEARQKHTTDARERLLLARQHLRKLISQSPYTERYLNMSDLIDIKMDEFNQQEAEEQEKAKKEQFSPERLLEEPVELPENVVVTPTEEAPQPQSEQTEGKEGTPPSLTPETP